MKLSRVLGLLIVAIVCASLSGLSPALGQNQPPPPPHNGGPPPRDDDDAAPPHDDGPVPTLADVHEVLLKAAGYQSDTPPTPAEQTALLQKALKMIKRIPPVYRGKLHAASRSIDAALSELEGGDTAHKAKGDIYDADDIIKSLM